MAAVEQWWEEDVVVEWAVLGMDVFVEHRGAFGMWIWGGLGLIRVERLVLLSEHSEWFLGG